MQLTKQKRKEKEREEERKKRKEKKKYEECFQFLPSKTTPMSHAHILCFPCQEQKAFPLKVHSLLLSRFHFLCTQSLYYFTPLQNQLLYSDRTILYPALSMKSKFTFSVLPQVLAGGQFLCSLLQQKYMKGLPTFNISLPYPQYTIQHAQKCVMTQFFQEANRINVSKSIATFLAIHLTLRYNKHTLFFASWTLLRMCTYVLATHFCLGQSLSFIHSSLWQYFKAHSTILIPPCYFLQSHRFKQICLLMHLQRTAITFFPLLFNQLEMTTEPTSIPESLIHLPQRSQVCCFFTENLQWYFL